MGKTMPRPEDVDGSFKASVLRLGTVFWSLLSFCNA